MVDLFFEVIVQFGDGLLVLCHSLYWRLSALPDPGYLLLENSQLLLVELNLGLDCSALLSELLVLLLQHIG